MDTPLVRPAQRAIEFPDGFSVRPLTFIDTLQHTNTYLDAMRGRDVEFAFVERSPATYVAARWIVMPLYYQLGCVGYGAFDQGKLAGMLYLRKWRQAMHIDGLAVHPDYRRRGLGRALLRLAQREADKLGRRWLSLRVTTTNEPAVRLYESEGFKPAHHAALRVKSSSLQEYQNGHLRLRPLVGPAARAMFLTYARADLSEGDAWAADILPAQMATRPLSLGRLRWLCMVNGAGVGYLTVRGGPASLRLFLATTPGTWGTSEEVNLVAQAMSRLPRRPEYVELQLASRGHHMATARKMTPLGSDEIALPKMTMLKPLAEVPELATGVDTNGR